MLEKDEKANAVTSLICDSNVNQTEYSSLTKDNPTDPQSLQSSGTNLSQGVIPHTEDWNDIWKR